MSSYNQTNTTNKKTTTQRKCFYCLAVIQHLSFVHIIMGYKVQCYPYQINVIKTDYNKHKPITYQANIYIVIQHDIYNIYYVKDNTLIYSQHRFMIIIHCVYTL